MSSKIYLDYWEDKTGGIKNFGDELNKYLLENLTNKSVERINFKFLFKNFLKALKILTFYFIKGNISFNEYFKYLKIHKNNTSVILFIGSILSHCRTPNYIVWGAGIMFKNDNFVDADFRAVRGEYSRKRILELGYNPPKYLGDPAILLPVVYKPHKSKTFKLGIIPHFRHFKEIKEKFSNNNQIQIIDLNSPIENVIDDICRCEKTISTSLHGIIVSHAYNIPSVWVKFREVNHNIGGDDIKFPDYFSSVGITEYDAYDIKKIKNFDLPLFLEDWNLNFNGIDTVKTSTINKIQKELIEISPVAIKEEYTIQ